MVRKVLQGLYADELTRETCEAALAEVGLAGTERAEQLSVPTLAALAAGLRRRGVVGLAGAGTPAEMN